MKNRCSKLNIFAAAASKIPAQKFCARACNPSQQGFSVFQLAKLKTILVVVSLSQLKFNN
ncbi:MAG: hypothetical protein EAZ90_19430 [Oscillatoriales cyanobacterium]|nr:MAG: hypothetical protein EAZ94_15515 [Oscillatoriales cyanobacterium]TAE23270.1 MAG: hypothetical protein EAZ93_15445 [Oscillatoriales cyanobacterium]TAE41057.1 MAG: hypothetical protein EAZ90_19430 [Oscillatoriales cyanobacterium]TAE69684.1 MAG: hypothetical protein EAZ86_08625 [Oscillatoriales cyanobacterium]TAF90192.1 MAG: hypothetical protein EAZ49_09555 [Oscillatoriales cyanobacterium]